MTDGPLGEVARALESAWAGATTVPAPTRTNPSLTRTDAYEIQEMIIAARVGAGRRRAGWKMGLTSAGPGTTPIVGTILDDMVVVSGSRLQLGTMVTPMVEAEVVVRIGEPIERPVSVAELREGRHEVGPGIEVIDYRTTDSTGVVDWIADNSTVAYAVVGEFVPVASVSASEIEVRLSSQVGDLATGRGDLVMGDPLAAVAWLSGHLAERGHHLETGDVILTGSLTGHHQVPSNVSTLVTADFGSLGTVEIGFEP